MLTQPPFHADAAGHALPSARMALALRQADLAGFLETIRQDLLWPFFHPYLHRIFFLVYGTTASRVTTVYIRGVAYRMNVFMYRATATSRSTTATCSRPGVG